MNLRSLKVASTLVMLACAFGYPAVLALEWHRTTIRIAGATTVEVTEVGWTGWGALAGVAAIALVVVNVMRLYRGIEPAPTFGILDLVLGVGILSATVAEVFSGGGANVEVAAVVVEANTILWPAWAGLALASAVALCGAVIAVPEAWQPARRPSPWPA